MRLLHFAGYESSASIRARRFRVLGSHCHGHPEIAAHLGIEVTTGLLGQGIANAVGMAVAEAKLAPSSGGNSSTTTPTPSSATAA